MNLCTLSDNLSELLARTAGAAGVMVALRELSSAPSWDVPVPVSDAIYAAAVYLDNLAEFVEGICQMAEEAREAENEAAGQ